MTLNEFTTEIAARLDRQYDLQYRQWLVPQINQWRSRLIRNSLTKDSSSRGQFLQTIHIPLTYGDVACGKLTCKGSYSEKIPKLLRIGDTPFEYLGSGDTTSPFRYNDQGTSIYINAGKTASHFIHYEINNSKIIIHNRRIDSIIGTGIFDEPQKALKWECDNGQGGCDWWNEEYPVSGDIAADIARAIWDALGVPRETLPQKQDQDE